MALISYGVPCAARLPNLLRVLPSLVRAANASPPVEIVVVDYANPEPIAPALEDARQQCAGGSRLTLVRYEAPHYHMGHARNLTIRASSGTWHIVANTDTETLPDYFAMIRQRIIETNAAYLEPRHLRGMAAIRMDVLLAAGGFDERFEFYGSEDRELRDRLARWGITFAGYPDGYLREDPTPNAVKVEHYRLTLSKREMHRRGRLVYDPSVAQGTKIANPGLGWGSLQGPCQTSLS